MTSGIRIQSLPRRPTNDQAAVRYRVAAIGCISTRLRRPTLAACQLVLLILSNKSDGVAKQLYLRPFGSDSSGITLEMLDSVVNGTIKPFLYHLCSHITQHVVTRKYTISTERKGQQYPACNRTLQNRRFVIE